AYYLYTLQEALDILEHGTHAPSLQDAFNLQSTDVTPVVDIHMNALRVPDQCIVQEEGSLIGFFDARVPPRTVLIDRGEGKDPEPTRATLMNRTLIAEFPDQVELGEVTSLLVAFSSSQVRGGGIPLEALSLGTTIDVIVQPQRGFVLEGRGENSLTITHD